MRAIIPCNSLKHVQIADRVAERRNRPAIDKLIGIQNFLNPNIPLVNNITIKTRNLSSISRGVV
ncbi:MAG: hypothetical protein LUO94_03475 [Methylococcaceae bacterium]|jgi:hypothetical protein|nr:hypothetical protein [Methylococcaceae bacterium]MDD1631238.1 hypothetical protein [Methylococcaceae bacterium]MDD1643432.1 hypothetical protein [Methylococcaceae bacterium]OYV20149.1 MAG: hypothetical protein CG441_504 [Methylococcaceae bacterium NSM2-1]